jgi:hypothetical protein
MARGSVQHYAPVALGKGGSLADVAAAMHKIRILYQFEPTTEASHAAYDAARHMNVAVEISLRRVPLLRQPCTADENPRSSFVSRGPG